jgi:hypothetical protein
LRARKEDFPLLETAQPHSWIVYELLKTRKKNRNLPDLPTLTLCTRGMSEEQHHSNTNPGNPTALLAGTKFPC